MPLHSFFPTLVYEARLREPRALNRELLRECAQIRAHDAEGRRWSTDNYPEGYTSYASLNQMHRMSSTFRELERQLDRHVRRFADSLEYDLEGRGLSMTDCWINMMPRHAAHGLHLHPTATISGTYYVRTPKGSPGLKLEDPRLDRMMAAPPRKAGSAAQSWIVVQAEAGKLILFESWLRHEVAPNRQPGERVSISFNYNWF